MLFLYVSEINVEKLAFNTTMIIIAILMASACKDSEN
jgi:hypothetical protein